MSSKVLLYSNNYRLLLCLDELIKMGKSVSHINIVHKSYKYFEQTLGEKTLTLSKDVNQLLEKSNTIITDKDSLYELSNYLKGRKVHLVVVDEKCSDYKYTEALKVMYEFTHIGRENLSIWLSTKAKNFNVNLKDYEIAVANKLYNARELRRAKFYAKDEVVKIGDIPDNIYIHEWAHQSEKYREPKPHWSSSVYHSIQEANELTHVNGKSIICKYILNNMPKVGEINDAFEIDLIPILVFKHMFNLK